MTYRKTNGWFSLWKTPILTHRPIFLVLFHIALITSKHLIFLLTIVTGKPWIHLSNTIQFFFLVATLNSWMSWTSFPHDRWRCQPFGPDHTCTLCQRKCRWHGEIRKRKCVEQDDENGWVQPWYKRFRIRVPCRQGPSELLPSTFACYQRWTCHQGSTLLEEGFCAMKSITSLYLANYLSSYVMLAMLKGHIILALFFFHLTDIMSFPLQVVQQREIMFIYIKASPATSIG